MFYRESCPSRGLLPESLKERLRSGLRLPIDLSILIAAFCLSYLPEYPDWKLLSLVVAFQILVLEITGARRFIWRRFSLEAVEPFFFSVLATVVLMLIVNIFLASHDFDLPPSVVFHDALYAFCGLLVIRIQRRIWFERSPEGIEKQKILENEFAEAARSEQYEKIQRLEEELEKARARIDLLEAERSQWLHFFERKAKRSLRTKLVYKAHDGHRIVYFDDVQYIESAGSYSRIFAREEKNHLARISLDNLEESLLDPEKFVRIHRTTIVRESEIERVTSGSRKFVVMRNDKRFPISREYWKSLRTRLFPKR